MAEEKGKKVESKFSLIVSDDKEPKVKLKPGMRFEVKAVSLVGVELKKPKKVAARLCGGSSTCLALVEID